MLDKDYKAYLIHPHTNSFTSTQKVSEKEYTYLFIASKVKTCNYKAYLIHPHTIHNTYPEMSIDYNKSSYTYIRTRPYFSKSHAYQHQYCRRITLGYTLQVPCRTLRERIRSYEAITQNCESWTNPAQECCGLSLTLNLARA